MTYKDDLELVEDMDFSPIDPAKLELVPFLKEGENSIGGTEMVRRAREELRVNLGQRHAEYLLEHQQEIPKEFRKYYIVFTGTIWRDPGGDRRVACLLRNSGQWVLHFDWLEGVYNSFVRLARSRNFLYFSPPKAGFSLLNCLFQPPSILPISIILSESSILRHGNTQKIQHSIRKIMVEKSEF